MRPRRDRRRDAWIAAQRALSENQRRRLVERILASGIFRGRLTEETSFMANQNQNNPNQGGQSQQGGGQELGWNRLSASAFKSFLSVAQVDEHALVIGPCPG